MKCPNYLCLRLSLSFQILSVALPCNTFAVATRPSISSLSIVPVGKYGMIAVKDLANNLKGNEEQTSLKFLKTRNLTGSKVKSTFTVNLPWYFINN